MSAESVRAFLASAAPDLEIVELPASSQTHTLSAAWGIRAAQIAKTLALSVGGRAVLAVVCGDSRLDNKKVKAVLGGKATMLAPEEAATITGHVLGGVCPFGLATPMPIYCDVQLRAFDEVVPGAGSTHTALRISPDRQLAEGDHGHAVVVLQRALRAAGGTIVVDGDFGPQTTAVVKEYQKAQGNAQTGRVEERTRFMLCMGGVIGQLS